MKEVKCSIPPDVLRDTVRLLDELAIRQQMQAEKMGSVPAAAELLKRAAEAKKTADVYHERYNQWIRDPDGCEEVTRK